MSSHREVQRLREEVDALLAKHEHRGRRIDFLRYAPVAGDIAQSTNRALLFMKKHLGFEPWDKQVEVIASFLEHKRTVARGAHSMGKDATLAPLMLYAAYCMRMLVIAISATERQLLGQLWREVSDRFGPDLPGELYRSDLLIGGKRRIIAMTSGSVSNLTGWHDPHGVFVAISEGQGESVEATAFDAAMANATDDLSKVVVVGNPVVASGRFYEVSQKRTWNAVRISAFDHPNIKQGRIIIPGGPSPDWPQEVAEEYGIDSAYYTGRVLAEFPMSAFDSLIPRAWLDAAVGRKLDQPPREVKAVA